MVSRPSPADRGAVRGAFGSINRERATAGLVVRGAFAFLHLRHFDSVLGPGMSE